MLTMRITPNASARPPAIRNWQGGREQTQLRARVMSGPLIQAKLHAW